MDVSHVNPDTVAPSVGYSHAVVVPLGEAAMVFVAGQVALDRDGALVGPGDMRAQADQAMRNVEAVLAAAGAGWGDVTHLRTFVTDVGRLAEVREVRARYITGPPPASTLVEVSGLVRDEFLIEVEAIAVTSSPPRR